MLLRQTWLLCMSTGWVSTVLLSTIVHCACLWTGLLSLGAEQVELCCSHSCVSAELAKEPMVLSPRKGLWEFTASWRLCRDDWRCECCGPTPSLHAVIEHLKPCWKPGGATAFLQIWLVPVTASKFVSWLGVMWNPLAFLSWFKGWQDASSSSGVQILFQPLQRIRQLWEAGLPLISWVDGDRVPVQWGAVGTLFVLLCPNSLFCFWNKRDYFPFFFTLVVGVWHKQWQAKVSSEHR